MKKHAFLVAAGHLFSLFLFNFLIGQNEIKSMIETVNKGRKRFSNLQYPKPIFFTFFLLFLLCCAVTV